MLCAAGNDVTLLARGPWKERLKQGLRIHHHLQGKDTVDHPMIIEGVSEGVTYDMVFAVMPYNKIGAILDELAAIQTPLVVMVGNNMSPTRMRDEILEKTICEKEVLFGFQATAGRRNVENGQLICERAGAGVMDIGGLHQLPQERTRSKVEAAFEGTGYRLRWQPDMEAYLICHLVAILPIGYLAYACDGDLRASTREQRRLMWQASQEAFGLLRSQGIRILPEEDARYYEPGFHGALMRFVYLLMAKTVMGDLIACEHCRNAYEEMELLDRAFSNVIARTPDYPMPSWDELKAQMPDWVQVHEQYGKL